MAEEKRRCVGRIDIPVTGRDSKAGEFDSVLVYTSHLGTSLLVTCRFNGEAEVILQRTECEELIKTLKAAVAQLRNP